MEFLPPTKDSQHFSDYQLDTAWTLLDDIDKKVITLNAEMQEVTDELAAISTQSLLSGAERTRKVRLEDRLSELYIDFIGTQNQSDTLIRAIEGFESGAMNASDLEGILDDIQPSNKAEDEPIGKLSKRKQAIREANLELAERMGISVDSWEFRATFGKNGTRQIDDNPELRTDPRRIASGRAASRLVARGAIDPWGAEEAFMNATADTHGGKTRHYGKNGKYYTGKSGRRVRKK